MKVKELPGSPALNITSLEYALADLIANLAPHHDPIERMPRYTLRISKMDLVIAVDLARYKPQITVEGDYDLRRHQWYLHMKGTEHATGSMHI